MKGEGSGARPPAARRGAASAPSDDAAADPGLFVRCPACKERSYRKDVERRLNVCASCGHHFRLTVEQRLLITVDRGSFVELDASLAASDPLGWVDQKPYPERVAAARAETGHGDALVTGTATIDEVPVALGIFDFAFMGGSMGTVVGEKLARLIETAIARALPLVVFTASGGARMQEGTLSLFQMAKSASMLTRLREAGLPYLCVLTDPTTGGVAASLAMLGDVQIAEPHALIGFAGPRVIEQTIHQTLPKGFQSAEMVLEHGLIDMVVPRRELRDTLARLLRVLVRGAAVQAARADSSRV
ncbi:acetyl-CoA carboxylase, carboxyltransferase subunit beta [Candidatus Binatia bacterium]|nr:acetyl-CoA carboxylase, carboxyltransferase subunit beta [Candidatus Binatia bacterium]